MANPVPVQRWAAPPSSAPFSQQQHPGWPPQQNGPSFTPGPPPIPQPPQAQSQFTPMPPPGPPGFNATSTPQQQTSIPQHPAPFNGPPMPPSGQSQPPFSGPPAGHSQPPFAGPPGPPGPPSQTHHQPSTMAPPTTMQNGPSFHSGPTQPAQPQFPPMQPPGPPRMSAPMPSQPGMPPQPGMQQQQHGFPPQQPYGAPPQPHGMPPQPGMPPGPPGPGPAHGLPPTPGMPPGGPGHMGGMSHGMPPTGPGPMASPGYPPTQGFGAAPGMPPTGPMPGFPSQPGMPPTGPMGPGYPGHGMPPSAPAQPAKRLDASMMPSAIQVMEDDRKTRSGVFQTGYPRAELPPLATTEFLSEDQGNSNPKFIRASTYAVPVSTDMVKQCSMPIALAITPMAELNAQEHPPPVVNLGQLGPVRCHRCKAYMCPFMEFNDGGRRFRCPFCKASSEVPAEYFAHLDHTGRRVDIYERPELCLGSYEFVATTEYCKNGLLPKPPAFIFMIDVSYNSVRNGIVKLICENIKGLLKNLPKDMGAERSEIRVGFATYDQAVHFYNLKSAVGQPAMLIVNDVQDMFVPLVDGFLVTPWEAEAAIDSLLQQIPNNFADTKVTEVILGPVIQAGLDALKSSDRAGKLFIFHSSLPLFEAPGKLKNRDDRKLLGTEKEKTILTPASEFYNKLGAECVTAGCSVDMFMFPNSYADVATIGCLCGTTGGQLYKYQYFQPEIDGQRFLNDLKHDLERPIVFDAIMRVRTSTGVRPTDFFGSFYMSNTTDVELASLDSDKTVTVEIKHDDKLDDDGVYVQAALLFTSAGGQRRLRIHNLSLAIAQDLASLYRAADLFATVNYMSKLGERAILQKSPKEVREMLTKTCAQILAAYRQHCSPSSSMGQLVLPEGMKLLPLFINCIIKHDAFVGGAEITVDDKAWLMQAVPSMRAVDTVYYFYPRLLPVTDVDGDEDLPTPVRCSYENLRSDSAYILENGVLIFLWIGGSIAPEWVHDVFGVQNFGQINADKHEVPEKDNQTSRRVRNMIAKVQLERPRSMKLFVIKQQDKLEPWFKRYLVEDRGAVGADSTPSYVDFLVHIHNEIREMLSH